MKRLAITLFLAYRCLAEDPVTVRVTVKEITPRACQPRQPLCAELVLNDFTIIGQDSVDFDAIDFTHLQLDQTPLFADPLVMKDNRNIKGKGAAIPETVAVHLFANPDEMRAIAARPAHRIEGDAYLWRRSRKSEFSGETKGRRIRFALDYADGNQTLALGLKGFASDPGPPQDIRDHIAGYGLERLLAVARVTIDWREPVIGNTPTHEYQRIHYTLGLRISPDEVLVPAAADPATVGPDRTETWAELWRFNDETKKGLREKKAQIVGQHLEILGIEPLGDRFRGGLELKRDSRALDKGELERVPRADLPGIVYRVKAANLGEFALPPGSATPPPQAVLTIVHLSEADDDRRSLIFTHVAGFRNASGNYDLVARPSLHLPQRPSRIYSIPAGSPVFYGETLVGVLSEDGAAVISMPRLRPQPTVGGLEKDQRRDQRVPPRPAPPPPPEKKVYSVEIRTTPPGAHVILDNRREGQSPLRKTDLEAGPHQLFLTLDGYRSKELTFDPAHDPVIQATLEPIVAAQPPPQPPPVKIDPPPLVKPDPVKAATQPKPEPVSTRPATVTLFIVHMPKNAEFFVRRRDAKPTDRPFASGTEDKAVELEKNVEYVVEVDYPGPPPSKIFSDPIRMDAEKIYEPPSAPAVHKKPVPKPPQKKTDDDPWKRKQKDKT